MKTKFSCRCSAAAAVANVNGDKNDRYGKDDKRTSDNDLVGCRKRTTKTWKYIGYSRIDRQTQAGSACYNRATMTFDILAPFWHA